MMDQFLEEVVVKKNQGMQSVLLVLANIMMAVCALVGVLGLNLLITALSGLFSGGDAGGVVFASDTNPLYISLAILAGFFLLVVFGGTAVLLFLKRDELKTEYEYTFTNGILDFAKVFNNKKRKALGTMNLKNIEACGKVASGSFNRYISMPQIKRTNWFLNREADLFYLYFTKDSQKRIIIIEPSEEMENLIRHAVQPGAFQTN